MFDGLPTEQKDPRKSLHVQEVDVPPLGPNECLIAPMASALNFNTVWTSIFEPLSTFGFLERLGRESDLGRRHDLPYHIVGSDASGVVVRVGPGVTALAPRRPRDRPLQLRGPRGARGSRRLDDRRTTADLGLRDQLRRGGGALAGQGQPADADADAPLVGGGRVAVADARDELSDAREPERRQHEARRRGAHLGCDGRAGGVRHPAGPQRWGHPRLRGLVTREGGAAALARRGARHRPAGRGLRLLGRRRAGT